ncbi:peptidoglycan-binding protein, partial [Pseudomonas sp. MPR-R1B]
NPPFTFEYSAIDALTREGLTRMDWTTYIIERIAYANEKFNGFGYAMHGVPSAYLWAGTNQYERGKYVADNVWSPYAVDQQLGVMGVL